MGLDVDPDRLPRGVERTLDGLAAFNRGIIAATADLACAFKVNLAFYEALGVDGWRLLRLTREALPRDLIAIADGKRGDVGHSSAFYARALFDELGFDAVTANPYLGFDALEPFLSRPERGVFVLCKTSNPGSAELQDLPCQVGGETVPLYQVVARRAVTWNRRGNCGLVVGATYPRELAAVRALAKDLPLLVPGVGAQGGDLEASVRAGVDDRGELLVVNASRQVLYASADEDWQKAARRTARDLRDALNVARGVGSGR